MLSIEPAAHLTRVRATTPPIHDITNHVAMNCMANVLLAGERAEGPGSFAVAVLDALHALDPDTLTARTRLEITDAT